MKKTYSAEFKAQVVREVLREHKTINQIASEFSVHPQLIYRWRDQMLANMATLFTNQQAKEQAEQELAHQRQVEQLYTEIGKLTTQLNWLKKSWTSG
jgi:transposase-like protein